MLGSRGSGDRIKHQFMITVTQEDNDHSGEAHNNTLDITRDSDETHINDKQINTATDEITTTTTTTTTSTTTTTTTATTTTTTSTTTTELEDYNNSTQDKTTDNMAVGPNRAHQAGTENGEQQLPLQVSKVRMISPHNAIQANTSTQCTNLNMNMNIDILKM